MSTGKRQVDGELHVYGMDGRIGVTIAMCRVHV